MAKVQGEDRLKSRKTIEQLFKTGSSFAVFPFRIFYMTKEEDTSPILAGFGVSARNFKKAVDRNRIKRLTREAYRLQKPDFYKKLEQTKIQLSLFIIYTGKDLPLFELVNDKVGKILQRLLNKIDEISTSSA
ncbi:MAG: ribonuclease P protein component [Chitinophagaceae bacterium]